MTRSSPRSAGPTVRIRGRKTPYLARERIGRREFFLLERIGSPLRERYRAFDPFAGPGGDFFLVQVWPHEPDIDQLLRVGRRLKDDRLPRIVAFDRAADGVRVVWSWVEGISLADYFAHLRAGRRPQVAPAEAVRLIHTLAHGVSQLHQGLGIVHADIQPANVILTSHPSRLRLIDFGAAWTVETTARRVRGDGFHPSYAAPELQQEATLVGFPADQFSMHVLCYELLTGAVPYEGLGGKAGRPEFVAAARMGLKSPSEVWVTGRALPRSLTDELDTVVCRGLALDPAERYPDRQAWLAALGNLMQQFRQPPRPLPPLLDAVTDLLRAVIGRRRRD